MENNNVGCECVCVCRSIASISDYVFAPQIHAHSSVAIVTFTLYCVESWMVCWCRWKVVKSEDFCQLVFLCITVFRCTHSNEFILILEPFSKVRTRTKKEQTDDFIDENGHTHTSTDNVVVPIPYRSIPLLYIIIEHTLRRIGQTRNVIDRFASFSESLQRISIFFSRLLCFIEFLFFLFSLNVMLEWHLAEQAHVSIWNNNMK